MIPSATKVRRTSLQPKTTYSVFARFRRSRVVLLRHASLQTALAMAANARGLRFHNPGDVFVVNDQTNAIVDEGNATSTAPIGLEPPSIGLETAPTYPETPSVESERAPNGLETATTDLERASTDVACELAARPPATAEPSVGGQLESVIARARQAHEQLSNLVRDLQQAGQQAVALYEDLGRELDALRAQRPHGT